MGCLTVVNGDGKFTISLKPGLLGKFGTLTNVRTLPMITLIFNDPTGSMTLNNLPAYLSQLKSVQFFSLSLRTNAFTEDWQPTVSTYKVWQDATAAKPKLNIQKTTPLEKRKR